MVHCSPSTSTITIASVLDRSATLACLTKVFSIIESARKHSRFDFRFLIFGDEVFLEEWNLVFSVLFSMPEVSFQSKLWNDRGNLQHLRNKAFEKPLIYSRLYLAEVFPDLRRFIYLDNDLVVTESLDQLMQASMHIVRYDSFDRKKGVRSGTAAIMDHVVTSGRDALQKVADLFGGGARSAGNSSAEKVANSANNVAKGRQAAAALVYERHQLNRGYIESNYKGDSDMLQLAMKHLGYDDLYPNSGVILFDGPLWRQRRYTERAEQLIDLNKNASTCVYAPSAGDQGVFYLALQDDVAFLPARFNMRRLPHHTVNFLKDGALGIVHFAGTTGGNAERLCQDPMQYPLFSTAVIPLYLSIVHSYNNTATKRFQAYQEEHANTYKRARSDEKGAAASNITIDSIQWSWRYGDLCNRAEARYRRAIKEERIRVRYNPGRAGDAFSIFLTYDRLTGVRKCGMC